MRSRLRRVAALAALAAPSLAACAGDTPPEPAAAPAAASPITAGGDAARPAADPGPPPPEGPLLATDRYPFRARIDFRHVRGNPLEPELRRFLGLLPPWRRFQESTGLDPIAEIDRIAVGSPGERSTRWLLLAQSAADPAKLREAVARYAEGLGAELSWARRGDRDVARFAVDADDPRELVVLREGWIALGPADATGRVEALVDAGRDTLVDGTPMPWSPEAPLVAGEPRTGLLAEGRPSTAFGDDGRGPHTPELFRIVGRIGDDGGLDLRWHGVYPNVEDADAARSYWEERRAAMASDTLVKMLGFADPFRDAEWRQDGAELEFRLALTLRQASLLLRFLAPMLSGTG